MFGLIRDAFYLLWLIVAAEVVRVANMSSRELRRLRLGLLLAVGGPALGMVLVAAFVGDPGWKAWLIGAVLLWVLACIIIFAWRFAVAGIIIAMLFDFGLHGRRGLGWGGALRNTVVAGVYGYVAAVLAVLVVEFGIGFLVILMPFSENRTAMLLFVLAGLGYAAYRIWLGTGGGTFVVMIAGRVCLAVLLAMGLWTMFPALGERTVGVRTRINKAIRDFDPFVRFGEASIPGWPADDCARRFAAQADGTPRQDGPPEVVRFMRRGDEVVGVCLKGAREYVDIRESMKPGVEYTLWASNPEQTMIYLVSGRKHKMSDLPMICRDVIVHVSGPRGATFIVARKGLVRSWADCPS